MIRHAGWELALRRASGVVTKRACEPARGRQRRVAHPGAVPSAGPAVPGRTGQPPALGSGTGPLRAARPSRRDAVHQRDRTLGGRTAATAKRPHGLSRSLTRHAPDGTRLVGFDNAHPARRRRGRGARRRGESGHGHRMRAIRPHECRDATTPPGDFRKEAGAVPKERGVIPQSRCRSELPATIG